MVTANKLTQLKISKLQEPKLYGDGAGLWLKVTSGGSKSWVLRYWVARRERWTGLGSYPDVSLAEARERAATLRKQVRDGLDPITAKKEAAAVACAEEARTVTFDWCAEEYIKAHRSGWKSAKHAEQWSSTLLTYVSPVFGPKEVGLVDTALVMNVLNAVWHTKAETASRLRARIEAVLDWATVHGYRSGENPARWKGHLDALLPARSKVAKAQHYAAMNWREMKPFIAQLITQNGVGALALQFTEIAP